MAQCFREGLPLPERIANAPALGLGLEIFYIGFHDLSSSRSVGMDIGPISWQTINDYCRSLDLPEEQALAMHFHVGKMDAAFLEYRRKKK